MTVQELVERWLGSEHGETPLREAKAKAAAVRCGLDWEAVLKAAEVYRAAHPKEPQG